MIRVRFYITPHGGAERRFGSELFFDDLAEMSTDPAVLFMSRKRTCRIEIQPL